MSEAVAEFTRYAFNAFDLIRIFAEPFANNPAVRAGIGECWFYLRRNLASQRNQGRPNSGLIDVCANSLTAATEASRAKAKLSHVTEIKLAASTLQT